MLGFNYSSVDITVIYLLIFVIYPGRGSAETSCSNVPKRLTNGHCECGFMPQPNHKLLSLVCKGLNASDMFSALHSRPNTLKSNEHPHRIVKDGENFSSQKNSISSDTILSEEESTWMIAKSSVGEVIVTESDIKCVDLDHFVYFTSLRKLVIANSKVTKLDDCDIDKGNQYKSETPSTMLNFLTYLDLSNNAIKSIKLRALEQAKNLKTINLSNNMLQHLDDIFTNLKLLEELNLSSNKLDARVDRVVFTDIPSSLKSLDISGWYQIIYYLLYLAIIIPCLFNGYRSSIISNLFQLDNAWPCSPELSWMYAWTKSFTSSNPIVNSSSLTCDAAGKPYPLFLVMKAYTEEVLPSCPQNCTCTINHITTIKHSKEEHKIEISDIKKGNDLAFVVVLCAGKELVEFPKLPKNTVTLDLSNNKVIPIKYKYFSLQTD